MGSDGFELLELVEAAMGTTLQQVEEFEWEELNEDFNSFKFSLVSALLTRINRQNKPLKKVKIGTVLLLADTGITATLLQNTQEWEIEAFLLQREFGRDGWSWLADCLQRKKRGELEIIYSSPVVVARAKKEDLEWIFDYCCPQDWLLLPHSQGPLPRNFEEWEEWKKMFRQYPTDEEDVLDGESFIVEHLEQLDYET